MKKILFLVFMIGSVSCYGQNQSTNKTMKEFFTELVDKNDRASSIALLCEIGSGISFIGSAAFFTSNRLKLAIACSSLSSTLHYLAKLKHDEVRERIQVRNNIILITNAFKNLKTQPQ